MTEWGWLPNDETNPNAATKLYAEHGLTPIPLHGTILGHPDGAACTCKAGAECENIGKHPALSGWQKTATSDPIGALELRRARGVPKNANVGLALGGDARLVAVDLDGPSGFAAFEKMRAGRHAPETLTNRSGRLDGGEHRIYRLQPHQDLSKVKNRAGVYRETWGPGLDVRAQGGQIVVSPSVHASGRRYAWSKRLPPAPMPDWMFEELTRERVADEPKHAPLGAGDVIAPMNDARRESYWAMVLGNAERDMSSCSEGGRNELLFSKACKLFELCVGEGFPRVDVSTTLEPAATAAGLTRGEIRKTIARAWVQVGSGPGKRIPDLALAPRTGAPARPVDDAPPPTPENWREELHAEDPFLAIEAGLTRDKHGSIKVTPGNIAKILMHHPEWVGVIAYDEFAARVVAIKDLPAPHGHKRMPAGAWSDPHTGSIPQWFDATYCLSISVKSLDEVIEYVARQRAFHPVKAFFEAVPWDGVERLDTWLIDHAGAPDTPFVRGASSMWVISAVARIYEPGCQVDHVLVLEGLQGKYKSAAIRSLVGEEWFSSTLPDIGSKDAMQELGGKMAFELAELASMKGAAVEKVKNFFTTLTDHYRPSYGRRSVSRPRQCVFCATTNEGQYLPDRTGNRRFWPVPCRGCDTAAIEANRAQIWAEALARYRVARSAELARPNHPGERWWPDEAFKRLATAEQEDREVHDAWDDALRDWIAKPNLLERGPDGLFREVLANTKEGIRMIDALAGIRKGGGGLSQRADEARLAACFRKLGYEPRLVGSDRRRVWVKRMPPRVAGAPHEAGCTYPPEHDGDCRTWDQRHAAASTITQPSLFAGKTDGPIAGSAIVPPSPDSAQKSGERNECEKEATHTRSSAPEAPSHTTKRTITHDHHDQSAERIEIIPDRGPQNMIVVDDQPAAMTDGAEPGDELFSGLFGGDVFSGSAPAPTPGPLSSPAGHKEPEPVLEQGPECTCFAGPGEGHSSWCEVGA